MRKLFILLLFIGYSARNVAQTQVEVLSTKQFQSHQRLFLAPLEGWVFKAGPIENGADPNLGVADWEKMNPTQLTTELEDENGRIEGWFRINIKLDESFKDIPLYLSRGLWAATDVYLDGQLIHSFGDTGDPYQAFNPILEYPVPVNLEVGKEHLLAIHFVDYESTFTQREIRLKPENLQPFLNLTGPDYITWVDRDYKHTHIYVTLCLGVSFLLFFLYWFLVYLNPDQTLFRIIAWYTTVVLIGAVVFFGNTFFEISYGLEKIRFVLFITFQAIMTLFGLFILEWVLTEKISKLSWAVLVMLLLMNIPAHIFSISQPFAIAFVLMLFHFGRKLYAHRNEIKGAKWTIIAAVVVPTVAIIIQIILHKYSLDLYNEYDKLILSFHVFSPPLFYLAYISVRFKETLSAVRVESQKLLEVTEEKRELLANQNLLLEAQVNERTKELKSSLENLKSTQAQLIQSEKMASLGELTAGIAHEIQNPLNFVNNFSEVSGELVDEMNEELEKGDIEEAKAIGKDLKENLSKIKHHGRRADTIVKGMLEHSRANKGEQTLTDINALADEYLRLSYHGLRAKDKSFNADFKLDLDPDLPKVNVVASDIGRVLLNLINNAFYAVDEKAKSTSQEEYKPEVIVKSTRTKSPSGDLGVEIFVQDNGNGIPEHIKEKIFQPFFTTKPTGSGTGLGLSLSYDIVKAHGGNLNVNSEPSVGTEFKISLPTKIVQN
ncbi:His Kinase A (phospho-acceptor) domain-containing protein [Algoriphagus ornithinivorans]|uniref:histidine kinase n=1 Tax=Algoriphagus ornithinivorans TaxID=226506 RepID=A0A1I5DYH0_9BACT|nr:ATP-binding protein [Algoriphagus ornithinivorans]SFO04213.1 His Kinase A (phospho-acceptor) domain-containing protein [Algoriphagus ornithinivorans]